MSSLIEWSTVGQIFVESLAAGLVVVSFFALGARMVTSGAEGKETGRSPVGPFALAALCFLVSAAAIAYGVYFTIDK